MAARKKPPTNSVKRNFDTEPVPDFSAMFARWQASDDYAVIKDMTVRTDKALRHSLFNGAREWLPAARGYPIAFLAFARGLGIPRGKPGLVAARLLFGRSLDPKRVSEYAIGMTYWFEHRDATLADAEATKLSDITRRSAADDEADLTSGAAEATQEPPLTRDEALAKMATRPADVEIQLPPGVTAPFGAVGVPLDDGIGCVWLARDLPDVVLRQLIRLLLAEDGNPEGLRRAA